MLSSAFAAAMPASVQVEFVDNWYVYHMGWGEVHCGTNQRRRAALESIDYTTWLAEVAL